MADERDAHVVIVDGVRYRKEEAPKGADKQAAPAANKARTTSSGSGSGSGAAAAKKAAAEKAAAEKAAAEKAAAEAAAQK